MQTVNSQIEALDKQILDHEVAIDILKMKRSEMIKQDAFAIQYFSEMYGLQMAAMVQPVITFSASSELLPEFMTAEERATLLTA